MKQLIKNPETKFVDVRTEMEFRMKHLEGAVNIPLDQIDYSLEKITAFGDSPVVVYCRSGNRSFQAAYFLRQHGFKNIHDGGAIDDLLYLMRNQEVVSHA